MAEQKPVVSIKRVEIIPEDLVEFFGGEANVGGTHLRKVNDSPVKVGLFVGKEMVGFSTGMRSTEPGEGRLLNFYSCYIKPEFRRKGFATRLFYRMIGEAKRLGFEGGIVDAARPGMRALIEKESKRLEAKGAEAPLGISMYRYNDDEEFEARIFPRKRVPKKPVLKPHLKP